MQGHNRTLAVPSVGWKEYNRERDEEIAAKAAAQDRGSDSSGNGPTGLADFRIVETLGTGETLDIDLLSNRVQLYVTSVATWWTAAECRRIAAELLRSAEALEA